MEQYGELVEKLWNRVNDAAMDHERMMAEAAAAIEAQAKRIEELEREKGELALDLLAAETERLGLS